MKRRIINYLFLWLLGFSIALPIGAQNLQQISGVVADEDALPLSGVEIIGISGNRYALTDQDGRYMFEADMSDLVKIIKKGFASQTMPLTEFASSKGIQMTAEKLMSGEENLVNVPFGTIEKRKITGSVYSIDVEEALQYDTRFSLGAALNGKVPGIFNNWDVYGLGGAVVIIDGVPRDPDFYDLTEVEEITVLKDAVSKILYGVQSEKAVILVTTKRGMPFKKRTNFFVEYGISQPKALPEYLGSMDYMKTVNQGFLNDGKTMKYSEEMLAEAASGNDPLNYPEEIYYSSKYLNNQVGYTNVKAEFSGGNQTTQYYVNMGWNHQNGWISMSDESSDKLKLRGNVDYQISERLSMTLDGIAYFDIYKGPDVDFWNSLSTSLPNAFPVVVPTSILTDPTSIEGATLIDDQYLLGGSKVYTSSLYGDLLLKGNRNELKRMMQINTALDYDMGFITEGLKAKAYLSFDFYNEFAAAQNSGYAVYDPVWRTDSTGIVDSVYVNTIGKDAPSNGFSADQNAALFHRRYGTFGTLTYDRVFGNHDISAIGVAYRDQLVSKDQEQDVKNLHFASMGTYMYNSKYILQLGGAYVGTQKLASESRMTFVPAAGIGWVLSEESFLSGSNFIDFLKLKATYGLTKNDNWNNYFLYQTAFETGGYFNYSNTSGGSAVRNREMNYLTVASDISWQLRKELTLGFEALLGHENLWLEANYFKNQAVDMVTAMNNAYPSLFGGVTAYQNYNSFIDQGVEAGLKYSISAGDVKITLGSNLIYAIPKVSQMDEPVYADDAQYRYKVGNVSDAIWGWVADGLYSETDLNADGTRVDGVSNSFGTVQAGDIKYVDLNGDMTIDEDDQKLIGNNQARLQYSLSMRINYKKFDFYVLGVGQTGEENMRKNAYYWTYGEMKYSVEALNAYGPDNLDVNAEMPRLSSNKNNNNYRSSTFWMYENNWFKTPTMQLSYNVGDIKGGFKNLNLYVRGYDIINLNKNRKYEDLRIGNAPKTWGGVVGLVSTF